MKPRYSPRTPARRGERGAVSLVVVLLFFIFAGLGLSMIFLSQVHLKLNAWRKWSTALDAAAENGIKRSFEDLLGDLGPGLSPVPLAAETIEELRADPETAVPRLLRESLGLPFPRTIEETWERMRWRSVADCVPRRTDDRGHYLWIQTGIAVEAEGSLARQPARRGASLEADLVLLAGRIPLSSFPLLFDRGTEEAGPWQDPAAAGISIAPLPGAVLQPRPVLSGGGLIPGDATPFLARTFDVEILRPQDLAPARLRSLLGLEPSTEPVPEGVYLIRNDMGLGGIFVQGDLEEMITAIEADFQVIAFRMAAGDWILKFSPFRSRTEFASPTTVERFDLVPAAIIIVNGRIQSLGGGAIAADGEIQAAEDGELPSVLGGIGLTIISSDKITLASHLVLQNVRWQDGVPVVRDPQSQVVVYSSGHDLLSGEEREGGIAVAPEAPSDLKIQASLTAGGRGFEILGGDKEVEILGGLHTSGYEGNGNALRVVPDPRNLAAVFSADGPLSAVPVLSVLSFRILTWKEF